MRIDITRISINKEIFCSDDCVYIPLIEYAYYFKLKFKLPALRSDGKELEYLDSTISVTKAYSRARNSPVSSSETPRLSI